MSVGGKEHKAVIVEVSMFLHKVWWTPIRVQYMMGLQGIKGPSYSFLHGSTKQIMNMRKESFATAMDLSHHIFPRIMPHIDAWIQLYEKYRRGRPTLLDLTIRVPASFRASTSYNIFGENYLQWRGPQPQLVVTETQLIKEILSNKDGAFVKTKPSSYGKKLIGDGIVVTRGEKWSKLRKISNYAFHAENLKEMVPAMTASVETMLERWRHREGKAIEVYEEFKLLTSEIISRTAFGSSYLEGKNIFNMLIKLSTIISRNEFKIPFPGIGKFVKSNDGTESDRIEHAIRDLIITMIQKREEKVVQGKSDNYGSDFLGSLIKFYHDADDNSNISIDTVIDECKIFYIAGQETTNGLLAWSIFLLAIHSDWQEKARKEVLELFGQQNPSPEGIARLKSMSMILNETLRLYSPAANMWRKVEREVRLGKLVLPANMDVYIPSLALHHDPNIWGKDAHLFKPERFAEGVAKATNNNTTAFIPFGLGPRMCVGLNFAAAETKIALSMILQRYTFTLSPTYVHSPMQMLTIRPKHGIEVIFHAL
ncbi:unnamed protein product [Camellia sinensis]